MFEAVLWEPAFDSNDWTLAATPPQPISSVVDTFDNWMQMFPKMSTGFIVLEHDLFPQTVDVGLIIIDKAVLVPNLTIKPVPHFVGDNKPYLELAGNNNIAGNDTTGTNSANGAYPSVSSGDIISVTIVSIIFVLFSLLLSY